MIYFVRGKLVDKAPTRAVVDVNGMGYEVHVSLNTYETLGNVGEDIQLVTYLHVREDVMMLFGFASSEEREIFLLLIGVSGVGPKLAQGILSGIAARELKRAVVNEDYHILTTIPGVGKKTAQRLIIDLKEKIKGVAGVPVGVEKEPPSLAEEAMMALISLGYNKSAAEKALRRVLKEEGGDLSLEELIKKALRHAS